MPSVGETYFIISGYIETTAIKVTIKIFWESIVCQALRVTYFYARFRNEDTKNREVKWFIYGHQLLIFRDKNMNVGLLVPHIHALTYYTIPSPQPLLRADFSRDPTKASLRLVTHPTTSYYSSSHSCYKWKLSAADFQVLLVPFSCPGFGRIDLQAPRHNLLPTLDKERDILAYIIVASLREWWKCICTHIKSVKKNLTPRTVSGAKGMKPKLIEA